MDIILHIADRKEWEASLTGGYYEPPSLGSDGFIHCSTIEQNVETANRYYAGRRGLVLLCIDRDKTDAEVKYEAPACMNDHRVDSLFPHIYGPLNVSAVIRVAGFVPGADGKFELPAEFGQLKSSPV